MSTNKVILSPSILAADFYRLGEQIRILEQNGIEYLHFDVMDGQFVPEISFGTPVLRSVKKRTPLTLDVHLMVENPHNMIHQYREAGADIITVHAETVTNLDEIVHCIRETGAEAGISVKPGTPAEILFDILGEIDQVLVMTVEPGFGGQKLIPETLQKVEKLRNRINEQGLHCRIEVDGGVTVKNIGTLVACGADMIVAGTAIFRGDMNQNITMIKEAVFDACK